MAGRRVRLSVVPRSIRLNRLRGRGNQAVIAPLFGVWLLFSVPVMAAFEPAETPDAIGEVETAQAVEVSDSAMAFENTSQQLSAAATSALDYSESREPCASQAPLKQPFFGDVHVHTRYSLDASTQGTRTTPAQAGHSCW